MSVKKIDGFTIKMKEKLGEGSYGTVYKAEEDQTGKTYAAKVINKQEIDADPYMKEALFSEIKVMRTIHSENCVRCFDVMESSNNYYVIQQICDSDLQKELKNQPDRKFDEVQAIRYLTQICNGFLVLVKEGIVHRDLKPQNIMIANGIAKIGDFGFAKKYERSPKGEGLLNSIVGTPLYMSKEILQHSPYTSKCDIWGIGFIFYEILHGRTPWTGNSPNGLLQNIIKKPLEISPDLSQATRDFLRKALGVKESDRMSWDQLFHHQIFKGYFSEKIKENKNLENLYKKVMADIRFYVNAENISLKKLWGSLGYDENTELKQKQFFELLRLITKDIEDVEQQYFFRAMDQNNDGFISLSQIQKEFQKYKIGMSSAIMNIPFEGITPEMENKIFQCFNRLYIILIKKKISLYQVFEVYDKEKSGELSLDQFSKIIRKLDENFQDEELELIFNLADTDNSKSIDFQEFNVFYCKVNGVPERLYKPKLN